MNTGLLFAVLLCTDPSQASQVCILEGRPPIYYPTLEACRLRVVAANENYARTGRSYARCVSRAPEWTPAD